MPTESEATPRPGTARRAASDIGGQLGLRALNVLVGLVVTIVLARALGTTGFGQWATIMAVVGIAAVVADLGLEPVTVNESAADPDRERQWLGALVLTKLTLGVLLSAISAGVIVLISGSPGMRVAGALVSATLLTSGAASLRVIFQSRLRNSISAAFELLFGLAWAIAILAVSSSGGSLAAYAGAFLSVTALVAAAQLATALRLAPVSLRAGSRYVGRLIRAGAPVAVATILIIAYGRLDQVLVFKINGAHAAGLYGAAYRVLDRVVLIPGSVMSTLFPLMSAVGAQNLARLRGLGQAAVDLLALVCLPALSFAIVAGGPVMGGLFGQGFAASGTSLAILMGAFAVVCLGYPVSFLAVVLNLQHRVARFALIGLVFNAVANLLLLGRFGFTAAAWTTLATELIVVGLVVRLVGRRIDLRFSPIRILRAGAAAAGMGIGVYAIREAGAGFALLLLAAPLLYLPLAMLTRAVDRQELALLFDPAA